MKWNYVPQFRGGEEERLCQWKSMICKERTLDVECRRRRRSNNWRRRGKKRHWLQRGRAHISDHLTKSAPFKLGMDNGQYGHQTIPVVSGREIEHSGPPSRIEGPLGRPFHLQSRRTRRGTRLWDSSLNIELYRLGKRPASLPQTTKDPNFSMATIVVK